MSIWVWVVLAGIIISAFMTVRSMRVEDQVNEKFIEEEGQVYMARMEKERQLRSDSSM